MTQISQVRNLRGCSPCHFVCCHGAQSSGLEKLLKKPLCHVGLIAGAMARNPCTARNYRIGKSKSLHASALRLMCAPSEANWWGKWQSWKSVFRICVVHLRTGQVTVQGPSKKVYLVWGTRYRHHQQREKKPPHTCLVKAPKGLDLYPLTASGESPGPSARKLSSSLGDAVTWTASS